MKIVFYGDSYVYGGGLNNEYGVKMGYIDNYNDYKKLQLNEKNNSDSYEFLVRNRWTSILENELKIKTENFGFPGSGWQYIQYRFFKNEIDNKEECIYIFCPPLDVKRFIISNKFENPNLQIVKNNDFNILNISKKNNEQNNENSFLDEIFDDNVNEQLNFQNIFGIISYLILNKKKFIFLPSWHKSLKSSFNFNYEDELDKKFFIFNSKDKVNSTNEISLLYKKFIFKYIKNIDFNFFWKENNMFLPSLHPNLEAQKHITAEYLIHINKILIK